MSHVLPTQGLCLCLLFAWLALPLSAQQFNLKSIEWRNLEEQRATGLFNQQHDFSPIDEAFALKESDQLLSYYFLAKNRQFGHIRWNTPEEVEKTQYRAEQRKALNEEVLKRAQERLRQLPGLPRYMGNRIETLAAMKEQDAKRRVAMECLFVIGDDESIVELGRFIFDGRNPDVTGPVPPLTLGVPKTIKFEAAGYLIGLLRNKPGIAAEIKAMPLSGKGWFEKTQNWWLNSDEAAPYRRKLADAGYVLPPGYPPMKELEGAKSTIAPSPVPPVKQTGSAPSTAKPPPIPSPQSAPDKESTGWHGWPLIVLILVLLAVPVSLALRKKRS